jgi:hypothetical protein
VLERVLESGTDPDVLVITPLRPEDTVSRTTLDTVAKNSLSIHWYSFRGPGNTAENFRLGTEAYRSLKGEESHSATIKIDNDTEWEPGTLDKMFHALVAGHLRSDVRVAYSYVSFSFRGKVNASFPAVDFNPVALLRGNYISSNSLFLSSIIRDVPLVTDDMYVRLLDYCYLLRLLARGYHGVPCREGGFVAVADERSVSARSPEDYREKLGLVRRDFVLPIVEAWSRWS